MMSALAQKCSLQKPTGIDQWTPQAAEKFKDIAADGVTIFNIRKLTTGETAIVELLLDGEDITLQLLPKTVDCYITQFDSLESFYIKRSDEEEQLSEVCKLEPLPGIEWDSESNKTFSKLNNEGKTLYQIEFVTSDVVRLYLNGRDIRSELGGVKNASTTSTPKKCFDIQTKPEKSSNVQDDVNELVLEVAENAIQLSEKTQMKQAVTEEVTQLVDHLVHSAVNEEQTALTTFSTEESLDTTQPKPEDSLSSQEDCNTLVLGMVTNAVNQSEKSEAVTEEVAGLVEEVVKNVTTRTNQETVSEGDTIKLDNKKVESNVRKNKENELDSISKECDNRVTNEVGGDEYLKVVNKTVNDCESISEDSGHVDEHSESNDEKQSNEQVNMHIVTKTLEEIVSGVVNSK